MAFPTYIEVPVEFQEDDFSCVPLCVKMVLEFIKQNYKECFIPISTIEEIALAMGTDALGTPLDGTEPLNKTLLKARPSIEFEGKTNCSLTDIEKDVEAGIPVIAWLKMPYAHSIVITGIDKQTLAVYYNDPLKGKKQIEMGKFIAFWEAIDRVLIKVKIGEKLQRTMTYFIEETKKEGDEVT